MNVATSVHYKSAIDHAGVTVIVPNLIALTSYTSYCYIEAAGGWGISHDTVLKTAMLFDTQCCKGITFLNAPSYVFGDPTKYKSSSPSNYVFTYAGQWPNTTSDTSSNTPSDPPLVSNTPIMIPSDTFSHMSRCLCSGSCSPIFQFHACCSTFLFRQWDRNCGWRDRISIIRIVHP